MSLRKAALVGCAEGPWTSIHNFRRPKVRVSGSEGLQVELFHEGKAEGTVLGLGVHETLPGTFVRVAVVAGDPTSVLCDILSGGD